MQCNDKTYYVGSTNNFDRRILEHESGQSKYTKKKLPVKVVFKKEFQNLKQARKFEYFIKRQRNKDFYSKLINGAFV
ncbi:MAG: GIY-YIG nuclease family protein [Candidatus Levybacteria bacterium]|nr:GIY-YIG nuclease family protein [Candidatus Levybacteria bacterium]